MSTTALLREQCAHRSRACPCPAWPSLMFVTSYDEGPIEGLATSACGQLGYFTCDTGTHTCRVYPLTPTEAALELASKELFEQHVGTYWSWDRSDDERFIRDTTHGYEDYMEARTTSFPGVDIDSQRAEYLSRQPVGTLEVRV